MSVSIRINDQLYEAAKQRSKAEFRSVQGQIEFWASIGRASLDNPDLPVEFVRDVRVARQEESEPFEFGD
jgi:hypothetical protein